MKKKNKSKKIIIIVVSVVALILIGVGCYLYFSGAFNKNDIDANKEVVTTIVDETTICADSKTLFYEDDFFRYYFPCDKSETIYLTIDGDRRLLKDYTKDSKFNIDNVIFALNQNDISYTREIKYTSIPVAILENTFVTITNDNNIDAYKYYETDEGMFYALSPKGDGTDNFAIMYVDSDGSTVRTDYFNVTVSGNKITATAQ